MKLSPAQRGYGPAHRRMRAAVALHVRAGLAVCARCGKPIAANDSDWDLGHTDDRRSWSGPEHAACNRRAGALKGWQAKRKHVDPPPPPGW